MFMGQSSNYDHLLNINKQMRDSHADEVMESRVTVGISCSGRCCDNFFPIPIFFLQILTQIWRLTTFVRPLSKTVHCQRECDPCFCKARKNSGGSTDASGGVTSLFGQQPHGHYCRSVVHHQTITVYALLLANCSIRCLFVFFKWATLQFFYISPGKCINTPWDTSTPGWESLLEMIWLTVLMSVP